MFYTLLCQGKLCPISKVTTEYSETIDTRLRLLKGFVDSQKDSVATAACHDSRADPLPGGRRSSLAAGASDRDKPNKRPCSYLLFFLFVNSFIIQYTLQLKIFFHSVSFFRKLPQCIYQGLCVFPYGSVLRNLFLNQVCYCYMIYNYHHSDTLTSINHAPTVVITIRQYLSSNQDSDISIYIKYT